jgi:hypothetical protein
VDRWRRLPRQSQFGLGCSVGVVSTVLLVDATLAGADRLGFIKHQV